MIGQIEAPVKGCIGQIDLSKDPRVQFLLDQETGDDGDSDPVQDRLLDGVGAAYDPAAAQGNTPLGKGLLRKQAGAAALFRVTMTSWESAARSTVFPTRG